MLVEHGLTGVGYPEEFGGGGGGSLTFAVMTEELSRLSAGTTLTPLVARLGAIPVMLAGSDEQKRELFGGIAEGRHLMSYCLTEPEAGSDAISMKTRYEVLPDGGFRLTGDQAVHHRGRRLGRVHGVRNEGPGAPRRRASRASSCTATTTGSRSARRSRRWASTGRRPGRSTSRTSRSRPTG